MGVGNRPALAASFPPETFSRYVTTLSMYTMGCNQGRASDAQGQHRQFVILSFGDPGAVNGVWGAWSWAGFASTSQVQSAVQSYMQGFWNCTVPGSKSFMMVAVGVTNNNAGVLYGQGVAWGNMVRGIESWINARGYGTQLLAEGADDIEPGYDSYSTTMNWINGYSSTGQVYFDFGSADGCPWYSTGGSNGACNNGWTQSELYNVAWGVPAAGASPQVYNSAMALQWENISLWGVSHRSAGKIQFVAGLSQHQACIDVGSACSGTDNTAYQSWSQLSNATAMSSSTAVAIPYSTEISYESR